MPENRIVFIMPMLFGHLNPTISFANVFIKQGHSVHYAGSKQLIRFTLKHNFKLFELQTLPVNKYTARPKDENAFKKWVSTIQNNELLNIYIERKADLKRLVDEINPNLVFLDEFCFLDFIILYSLNPSLKICILQTKMGMYYSKNAPPSNYYAFPGSMSSYLWNWVLAGRKLKRFYKKCLYIGKNFESRLEKIMKMEHIPSKYKINYKKIFSLSFTHVPEILFYASEFDFPNVAPLPWQINLSPAVALERREIITEELRQFLTLAKTQEQNRIIYCSLGTVSDRHISDEDVKANFIDKVLKVAADNQDFFFVISFGNDLQKEKYVNLPGKNILVLHFAPQIYVLKYADVFLTHGGNNSIYESIYSKTPMLIFPLNNDWDQNGCAARAVYHGIGLKANLGDSAQSISTQIKTLLATDSYKNAVSALADVVMKKYTDEYMINKLNESGI